MKTSSLTSSSNTTHHHQHHNRILNSNTSKKMCFDLKQHFADAFKRMFQIYANDQLCDVVLICKNDFRINAHRIVLSSVSDYFHAMFTNNLSESFKNEIEMCNMDGYALKALIDFIYSGNIDLNDMNVFSILNAALFLQLQSVIKIGCDYLKSNLNITNCVSIRRFSDEQSLNDLKDIGFKYILDNFEQIALNEDLLNELTVNEISELFESEYLNVSSEEIVYETLMKWINLNKEKRTESLANLLTNVKLPLLKSSYLTKQIETNKLLSINISCQSLILEAVTYHLNPDKFTSYPIERTNPRKSTLGYLLCIGGVDNVKNSVPSGQHYFIEKYDVRNETWLPLNTQSNTSNSLALTISSSMNNVNLNVSNVNSNVMKRLQFGVALKNSSIVIICGGRDGLKTLSSVECYHIERDIWSTLPSMLTHRHGLQSTFINDESVLYSIGGHDGWCFLNTVERFDFDTKSWTYVASMNNPRSTFGVAVVDNYCYAIGGRDSNNCLNLVECYNPLLNRWSNCASMIKKRGSVGVTVCHGIIYAVGGHNSSSTNSSSTSNSNLRLDCGERYDPKTDQWTMINNISRPREAISISNLGSSYIYIAGGYDGHKYLTDCERYDPVKNEWSKIQPLSCPRAGGCLIHVPVKNELNDTCVITKKAKLKSISFANTKALMSIENENENMPKVASSMSLKQPYIYEANI